MKLGFRGTLFTISLVLIVMVGSISALFLEGQLRGWFSERLKQELLQQTQIIRLLLLQLQKIPTRQSVQKHVKKWGDTLKTRITIILQDGTVIGDSQLTSVQIRSLENHRHRPEVQAALTQPFGSSRRWSHTLQKQMLYVAQRFQNKTGTWMIRTSFPMKDVEEAIGRLRIFIFIAGVLGLIVAVFMGFLASHLMARSLRNLMLSTRAATQRDGHPLIQIQPGDELAGLAGSLSRMSDELESMVSQLAKERNRFEAVLESMNAAVITFDTEQNITLVNRSASSILHWHGVSTGQPLFSLTSSEELKNLVQQVLDGHAGSMELVLESPPCQLLVRATPLGKSAGGVMVLHDVTELRRLETIRRDFVANVSHELRTPVSIIRANAETLLAGAIEDPEFAQEFLEAMMRSAERLSHLISDLLDISKIEAGEYKLESEKLELFPIVKKLSDAVQPMLQNKHHTLTLEWEEELFAYGDARAIEQILMNYLDNSIKYTQDSGQLILRGYRKDQDFIRIEVQDNGPGIAPKHRLRIFERFYRVDKGRSRHMGGTGLGLAIVKHLTESMGGKVGVENIQPHGSLFWFTLPLHPHTASLPDSNSSLLAAMS